MRIELDDTAAAGELVGFLRSFDCSAGLVAPHLIEVEFEQPGEGPARESLDQIRLDAFVRVWNSLHPSAHATVVSDQPVPSG